MLFYIIGFLVGAAELGMAFYAGYKIGRKKATVVPAPTTIEPRHAPAPVNQGGAVKIRTIETKKREDLQPLRDRMQALFGVSDDGKVQ